MVGHKKIDHDCHELDVIRMQKSMRALKDEFEADEAVEQTKTFITELR